MVAETPAQYRQLVHKQFGRLAGTVQKLYPLQRYTSPFVAYRTIMADSASVCPMLKADTQLSRYLPVWADIDNDADNPAGEGLTQVLGAQHSETNGLVHFPTSKLDPNQKALQTQLLLEWTTLARTGNPMAAQTPAWPLFKSYLNPVLELRPAGASSTAPAGFIASQHNCAFWGQITHY